MKTLLLAAAVALASFGVAQAAPASGSYVVPVTGTVGGAPASGTFTIKQFTKINNTLNAVGTLTIHNITTSVAIPVLASNPPAASAAQPAPAAPGQAPGASCPVLNLVLGPLNLNLLGLDVSLNQVVLNITAVPGAGNLLGNLLCDVSGLLNGNGALDHLVNVLNQILGSL